MTPQAYKDFLADLRNQLWPAPGEPKSLRVAHNAFFQAAMMDLAGCVKGLSEHNVSVRRACSCYLQNGLTVTDLPRGIIQWVYTIANSDWSNPVHYDEVNFSDMLVWQRRLTALWTPPTNAGLTLPALQQGFKYPEKSTDAPHRAHLGWFCKQNKRLYIAPWLQSNESLVIEWDGVRQRWNDDDILDLDEWDFQLQEAVKLYVQKCHARDFGNKSDVPGLEQLYNNKRADCMWSAEERLRKRRKDVIAINSVRRPRAVEVEAEAVPAAATAKSGFVFANIGDFGYRPNADSEAARADVAALVKSWDDGTKNFMILSNGDNGHSDGTYDYAADVGKLYGSYVTDNWNTNRFWPAIGNHDWLNSGKGDLNGFFEYFKALTGKGNYYDFVWGPAHFFVLDASMANTSQSDWGETDLFNQTNGIWRGQAGWLKTLASQSVAQWKIAVLHNPPWSSGPSNPGFSQFRVPFADWGFDLVLSGHDHLYERLTINNRLYIVNGAGGGSLHDFKEPAVQGSDVRVKEFGALRGTVTCGSLELEFFNRDRVLRDTVKLLK